MVKSPTPEWVNFENGVLSFGTKKLRWDNPSLRELELSILEIQKQLAPGGLFLITGNRQMRPIRRLLAHYFEGVDPKPGDRFPRVRIVKGGNIKQITCQKRGTNVGTLHFDELAENYESEIPEHLVAEYLERKIERLRRANLRGIGLELGAGMGQYSRAARDQLGLEVIGSDRHRNVARMAKQNGTPMAVIDGEHLPFGSSSLDFVFMVNMLHHMKRGEQVGCIAEIERVLKVGGKFIIFEMNLRNPAIWMYMRFIFPRLKQIDRGDEEFLAPSKIPTTRLVEKWRDFYTFVPDFAPRFMMPALLPIERLIERSPMRSLSAHYTVCFEKELE